ncbi:hypothetical protein ACWGOQ_0005940 [Aquimarina sp. M1]
MNSLHTIYPFILTCFLTISIYGQEKVTGQSTFSDKKSFSDVVVTNSLPTSKMAVHDPNFELDKQIKYTLINDTEPVIISIYKPYLSLDKTSSSVATILSKRSHRKAKMKTVLLTNKSILADCSMYYLL